MTRDLLMLKYSPANFAKTGTYYSGTAEAILKDVAKKCGIEKILYFSTVLEDTQSRMSRYALNKKVLIELAVIRMCDLKLDDSNKALLARIAELEKRPVSAPAVFEDAPVISEEPPIPLTFEPAQAEPKPELPAEKPEYTEKPKEEEFEFFAEFIEALNTRSDLASFVSKADVKLRGNTLIIRTDFIGHSLLSKPDAVIALNNAARSATNKNIKIEIKQNNLVQDEFQTSLLDSLGE